MNFFVKRTCRVLLRQYSLFGSLFQTSPEKRAAFRESVDQTIIQLYQKEIENFIRAYPKVWTEEQTIRHMLAHRSSICRYGDGEFKLIIGRRHKSFQDINQELNEKMLDVLRSDVPNILIAIHPVHEYETLGRIWQKYIIRMGGQILSLLDKNREYPSTGVFRLLPLQSKAAFITRVQLIKQLWHNRKIVFVVGRNSRFTFEPELFNNVRSIEYIYAPPKNAFAEYTLIMDQVLQYDRDNYLILIVLGPTATVMAFDLAQQGYQAIDFGQMPGTFRQGKKILWGNWNAPIPELLNNKD